MWSKKRYRVKKKKTYFVHPGNAGVDVNDSSFLPMPKCTGNSPPNMISPSFLKPFPLSFEKMQSEEVTKHIFKPSKTNKYVLRDFKK